MRRKGYRSATAVRQADGQATEREKVAFFELSDRLTHTSNRREQERLKNELARMTFGEA